MGRPPSPPQIYQKIICVWNNSHTTSEHWQRSPDFQKNIPISSESGRAKDKDKKKGVKEVQDRDLHPREVVVKEENFPHTFLVSYPLTDRVRGELGNLRGEHSETGSLKAKQKIHHRDHAKWHFPGAKQLTCLHLPTASGG